MSKITIVLLVIVAILIIAMVVLYFLGKKAQKKKAEQDEQLVAAAQLHGGQAGGLDLGQVIHKVMGRGGILVGGHAVQLAADLVKIKNKHNGSSSNGPYRNFTS